MLHVYRFYSRYFIYSDRASRVPDYVIKYKFFFSVVYISFRFAVAAVAGYIYSARAAPVYFRVPVIFCDVSVFSIFIILSDITFS